MRNQWWKYFCLSMLIAGAMGCGGAKPAEAPAPAEPSYTTTATVKDLMQSMVDVAADDVWNSVSTVSTAAGLVETMPKTDDDWLKVKRGALTLAEATNLLMIPGRKVARPGEKSETPGVELEPEEMEALIDKDRAAWNMRAADLHKAALEVLEAVEQKNVEKVFEIGERIEHACEGCHSHYWYPNEKIPPVSIDLDTPPTPAQTAPAK